MTAALTSGEQLSPAARHVAVAFERPRFELIQDIQAFQALEPEWNALFEEAGTPVQVFQTFAWNRCWCRHYLASPAGPRLAIVTGRQRGRLVLVWPLVVQSIAGLRQLGWMGDPVSQYGDILAAPEALASEMPAAAWQFAVKTTRADVAHLRKVRADAAVAPTLARLGASPGAAEAAPYIRLDGASFEACEARFSLKGCKNRRRHMRRLLQTHAVEFMSRAGDANARRQRATGGGDEARRTGAKGAGLARAGR